MAEQKASTNEPKATVKKAPPSQVVVSNTNLTEDEANEIRDEALAEKAEEGKVWHPLSGTGGGVHGDAVVIHNPDIDQPVVVTKGQQVRFESEDYKVREAPDPGK
jgi:hypothetical protein